MPFMQFKNKLLCLTLSFVLLFGMTVTAAQTDGIDQDRIVNIDASQPIIALGADLSAQQRQDVLAMMGVSEADLSSYKVISITNEMEHQYLDAYLDASVIGSKSLSSVMITPAESGHGVLVTTQNITYCTTGMYRNALLTAGVTDADIMVVGPTQISGTAALIGAIKGYEEMSGETVADATLDIAMDELITTGELAMKDADSDDIEALIAFVKAKVAAGQLSSDADIQAAIEEGQEKFGVSLSAEEIAQIVEIMQKINQLGLDPNMLIEQAEDLYSKFGTDFLEHIGDGSELAKAAAGNIFSRIGSAIKNFFAGLFG